MATLDCTRSHAIKQLCLCLSAVGHLQSNNSYMSLNVVYIYVTLRRGWIPNRTNPQSRSVSEPDSLAEPGAQFKGALAKILTTH